MECTIRPQSARCVTRELVEVGEWAACRPALAPIATQSQFDARWQEHKEAIPRPRPQRSGRKSNKGRGIDFVLVT